MQTEGGIELNLYESKFYYDLFNLRFYFSSEFYKEKFKNEVHDYIMIETIKFKNKYKIKIMLNNYFAIAFYKRIEKRGFRIVEKNTKKELNEDILFFEELKI